MAKFRLYNRTLCPELWDQYQHLDPRVRVNLLRMAYDFYEKTKFPAKMIDAYLMGSAANYNWSPDSDVDVHVIIDYNQLRMPIETAAKAVKTAGAQWNAEHDVLVKGHKVELNIQNVAEQKPHVTGIYSLVKDQWIRKPSLQLPKIDKHTVQLQFMGMKTYIDEVIVSGDRERMKEAKKYVDAYRQFGLDTQGELSVENVVFKILRSRGLIKRLKDSINSTYDQEMTVKETFIDQIPDAPYVIVGVTNANGETVSDITPTGRSGHGSLSVKHGESGAFTRPLYWRYRKKDNTLYADRTLNQALGNVPYVIQHLKDKYHIENPRVSTDPDEYITKGHSVVETKGKRRLTLHAPARNGTIGIYLGNIRFAQMYKPAEGWGQWAGRWVLNREGPAIKAGFPNMDKGYDRPEDLLADMQKILDAPLSESHIDWAAWEKEHNKDVDSIPIPGTNMRMAAKKQQPPQALKTKSQMLGFGGDPNDPRHSEPKKLTEEGFGAGIPEDDRLKIKNDDGSVQRWRIRSKDAPKTPKMTGEIVLAVTKYDEPQKGDCLSEGLIMESPRQKNLKKNRKPLTDEERAEVMKAKAVWHHGPSGEETPAVWKSVVNGKTWYCCNTHRAIQIKPTLKGAIKAFEFIKTTA